jgi:hypothetical protein
MHVLGAPCLAVGSVSLGEHQLGERARDGWGRRLPVIGRAGEGTKAVPTLRWPAVVAQIDSRVAATPDGASMNVVLRIDTGAYT